MNLYISFDGVHIKMPCRALWLGPCLVYFHCYLSNERSTKTYCLTWWDPCQSQWDRPPLTMNRSEDCRRPHFDLKWWVIYTPYQTEKLLYYCSIRVQNKLLELVLQSCPDLLCKANQQSLIALDMEVLFGTGWNSGIGEWEIKKAQGKGDGTLKS